MNGSRKVLSEADRAEWASYTRRITPLRGRERTEAPMDFVALAPAVRPRGPAPETVPRTRLAGVAIGMPPPGLDNATWQRLRTGKLTATRRLDLHGHTAQRAFVTLAQFLRTAHADHVRCVEVITGRGSAEGGGVLRRELPLWLNLPELRPLVLAVAYPHPANLGAVRLLLRRIRQ